MATRNVEWLDTSLLDINEGQMEGLPKNPRSWTKDELNKLKKSLEETPELFEARPILAYDYDGRLLVLGGNMRLSAAKALGMAKVPVYVYPSSTPLEKLKEIVIKDNGAFGAWDWDMLANEWDTMPLDAWGVVGFVNVEKEVKKAEKERRGDVPFTEVLGEEHNCIVLFFDNSVDWAQAQTLFELKPIRQLSTAKGVQSESFSHRYGVGRVLKGAEAIETLKKNLGL